MGVGREAFAVAYRLQCEMFSLLRHDVANTVP